MAQLPSGQAYHALNPLISIIREPLQTDQAFLVLGRKRSFKRLGLLDLVAPLISSSSTPETNDEMEVIADPEIAEE
jgi:hypothetical protein